MRIQRYPDGGHSWTWFVWGRHPKGSLTWTHSLTVSRLRSREDMPLLGWWSTDGQQRHHGVRVGKIEIGLHRQEPILWLSGKGR